MIFPNVTFLRGADHDLKKIHKKDPVNCKRILDDIARLGSGTLPPQGRKRLRNMDAYQFDCGRFRVVYNQRSKSLGRRAVGT